MEIIAVCMAALAVGCAARDELPAACELGRFPPVEVLQQWCDCNRAVAQLCKFNAGAFPDRGWEEAAQECDRLEWPIWHLLRAHDGEWNRRYHLGEARRKMPPEWWACPAMIEMVPYRNLPKPNV